MKKILIILVSLFAAMTLFAGEGALNGRFTINAAGDHVQFSQGNLQYQPSTQTWQFAANQYDVIGAGNANISETYTGRIDLFGWGTGNNPLLRTKNIADFDSFIDWGTNAINNGGNKANAWRTLTKDEWNYLFVQRAEAAKHFGTGTVNNVCGTILLPDDWTLPEGAVFHNSTDYLEYDSTLFKYVNSNNNNFSQNTYTAEQWQVMENAGAVFLPLAGQRDSVTVSFVTVNGRYWATEKFGTKYADMLNFDKGVLSPASNGVSRYYGLAVRLVQPESFVVTITQPEHGTINIVETVDLTSVNKYTVLHLTAVPDEGYELDQWVNYDPITGLVVTQDTTVTCIFVEETPDVEKRLTGIFSVGGGKHIRFSQGNLQYKASAGKYRFAEEQYTIVPPTDNQQISPTFTGWIDAFGWGTGNNPVMASTNADDYSTTFTDWGLNPISNGGNELGYWHTPTRMEWFNLFTQRKNASSLFGFGKVNGVSGLIILPDDWELPEGVTFNSAKDKGVTYNEEQFKYINDNRDNFTHNTYTAAQWEVMEEAGAVFLPITKPRVGTNVYTAGGNYWSADLNPSTIYTGKYPYFLQFNDQLLHPSSYGNYIYTGLAVRLVHEVSNYTVTRVHPENGTIMPIEEIDLNNVVEGTVIHFTIATDDSREVDEWINYNPETGLVVTSDTTISCTLKKKTYEVTFLDWDDSVLKAAQIVEWGEAAIPPADPEREGYTFTGWNRDFSCIKTNLTVKATYSHNTYTISVIAENGTVQAQDTAGHIVGFENHFPHGTKLILTAIPDEGYVFDRWSDNYNPATGLVLTSDITITAYFVEESTTGIQMINTEKKAQKVIRNGQVIILRDGKEYNILGAELQ